MSYVIIKIPLISRFYLMIFVSDQVDLRLVEVVTALSLEGSFHVKSEQDFMCVSCSVSFCSQILQC